MPHAAAVVGHGGHGTTLGALAHGVPQVVVPLFSIDQWANAAAVERAGAGVALDADRSSRRVLARPGPEVIDGLGPAVQRILAEPRPRHSGSPPRCARCRPPKPPLDAPAASRCGPRGIPSCSSSTRSEPRAALSAATSSVVRPWAITLETSDTEAITLRPRTSIFERSTSSVDSPAWAIIVRLTSASSASASVIIPLSVRPLTLRKRRSAKWPWTVRTANGPTNDRVSRRRLPPTPMMSAVDPPSLKISSMTGKLLVSTVVAMPVSTIRRATK